jgi:hypothetical protein
VAETFTVPANFPVGGALVSCAILDPQNRAPAIRFASEGVAADGWLPLETMDVVASLS